MEQKIVGSDGSQITPATAVQSSPGKTADSAGPARYGAMDRTRALYERPVVTVDDDATFADVKLAIEGEFTEQGIESFLRTLVRSGLRIREFEQVLAKGKLGAITPTLYARLSPGDQGQIRELYLAALEQVAPKLRDRFFKLYAYY